MEEKRGENPFDEPVRLLRAGDPAKIAVVAGASWESWGDGGTLTLPVLSGAVTVSWPEVAVSAPHGLDSFSLRLLSLLYLAKTDGTAPSGKWLAYRELPGGRFYEPVVQRSVEEPLALAFGADAGAFASACEGMGGLPVSHGDAASSFALFPRVLLSFILWRADDQFPARVQVLFDSSAIRHLNAFDLRMGAQEISTRLIRAGGGSR